MEEEISLSPRAKIIIFFIIGLLAGGSIVSWYDSKRDYREPAKVADELEKMMYNSTYQETFMHYFADTLLLNDKTTIGELKYTYKVYGGQSRDLLEMQINRICYKKEWK